MSDWESDKPPEWGDKPVESDQEKNKEKSAGKGGLFGGKKPAMPPESGRDWRLIEKLVMSLQAEQRRSRRWGIFFKLLTFGYLFALLFFLRTPFGDGVETAVAEHTAVVEVNGTISSEELASADNIIGALRSAFEAKNSRAVVLRINSPGGSPVQAGYIYDEMMRLREEYPDKKLYAVISDIGASGAYYIAAAADEIYANRASLVGSIGVVAGGFGFTDLMDKVGVDRRLYTAGENKAFLDPFSPEQQEEVTFWQSVLENTHQQFIEAVKKGRGDRLSDNDKLFSGLVWSGEQALELGLVDGLGSTSWVARQLVGEENIVDYTRGKSPFRELVDQLGVSVGAGLADQLLESRLELR